MILLQELFYSIKKNGSLMVISIFLLTTAMLLLNIFVAFSYQSNYYSEKLLHHFSDKKMYEITDTLYEPNAFESFNSSDDSLITVQNFYEALNTEEKFDYLALFNQATPIQNFKGNQQFGSNRENNEIYTVELEGKVYNFFDIKSIQLNKKAYDFYSLQLSNGSLFNWEAINYDSKILPVLLGSDYQKIYEIGDQLDGAYMSEFFQFEVVGFLEKNSFVFFKGNAEYYLDDHMVIPYPITPPTYTPEMESFLTYLYFDMINGIVATTPDYSAENLVETIANLGKQTTFNHYHILGLSSFVEQYSDMFHVLKNNQSLIVLLFSILILGVALLLFFIAYISFIRRKEVYQLYYSSGKNKQFLAKMILLEQAFPFAFVGIFYGYSLYLLRIGSQASFIIWIFVPLFALSSTSTFVIMLLLPKQLRENFRRDL